MIFDVAYGAHWHSLVFIFRCVLWGPSYNKLLGCLNSGTPRRFLESNFRHGTRVATHARAM